MLFLFQVHGATYDNIHSSFVSDSSSNDWGKVPLTTMKQDILNLLFTVLASPLGEEESQDDFKDPGELGKLLILVVRLLWVPLPKVMSVLNLSVPFLTLSAIYSLACSMFSFLHFPFFPSSSSILSLLSGFQSLLIFSGSSDLFSLLFEFP